MKSSRKESSSIGSPRSIASGDLLAVEEHADARAPRVSPVRAGVMHHHGAENHQRAQFQSPRSQPPANFRRMVLAQLDQALV